MKIINIEDFFHPNAGYQINIISKYLAKFGHEVIIITADMAKIPNQLTSFFGKNNIEKYDREYEKITGVKIIRVPIKKFISGRAIFKKDIYKLVERLKPDVLYVHGNDTLVGIHYILKLGKLNYALISDSHMLEMASTNKFNKLFRLFYKKIITPKIIKHDLTVIRTQNDIYVKKCLGIPLKQAPWISYGSDTLLFHPNNNVKKIFRKNNNISDDAFVILYAGKLDESKGGEFLAKAIQKKFNTKKNLKIIIVGNTVGEYGKNVERLFDDSENEILRFPTQFYMNLAKFYQSCDLVVFPKQCSLSFYDAQACGIPVLFEDNNINKDRSKFNNAWTFKCDDVNDFRKKIEDAINLSKIEYDEIKDSAYRYIINNYNYEAKAREYEKIIIDVYKKKGKV